jgi:hypothetical protein
LYLCWFFLLQITSAVALKRSGRLEALLTRYERGACIFRE